MTITVAIRNAYALHRTKTCINCQLSRINYRSTHKICCGSPQQNPNSNQTTQHMCLGRTHQLNVFFLTKDENSVPPFIPRSKKINNYTFVFLSYLYHCGPFLVFFTAETVMLLSWGFWQGCIFPTEGSFFELTQILFGRLQKFGGIAAYLASASHI